MNIDEIQRTIPDGVQDTLIDDWYFRSPDGDKYEDVRQRLNDWLSAVERSVVAVSHGLVSKLIRGSYLGLSREETLALPIPQGVIWVLEAQTLSQL